MFDDLGVAGNFRLSFWALLLSPTVLFASCPFELVTEFCGGGVGVGAGVEAKEEDAEDC
jgi:hypothetical protein